MKHAVAKLTVSAVAIFVASLAPTIFVPPILFN